MRDFTSSQLHTMVSALGDYALKQADASESWASEGMAEMRASVKASNGLDMVESCAREARSAARLRFDAAYELHRRGKIDSTLAHPDRETCPACE